MQSTTTYPLAHASASPTTHNLPHPAVARRRVQDDYFCLSAKRMSCYANWFVFYKVNAKHDNLPSRTCICIADYSQSVSSCRRKTKRGGSRQLSAYLLPCKFAVTTFAEYPNGCNVALTWFGLSSSEGKAQSRTLSPVHPRRDYSQSASSCRRKTKGGG
jgi:hypothetical protein